MLSTAVSVERFPKFRRRTHKIINSTALPKETLISAPIVSPRRLATHSVAWLNNPAKGMIATAFMAKMMAGFNPTASTAIPTGTKTSRTLTQLWHKAVLVC